MKRMILVLSLAMLVTPAVAQNSQDRSRSLSTMAPFAVTPMAPPPPIHQPRQNWTGQSYGPNNNFQTWTAPGQRSVTCQTIGNFVHCN